MRFIAGRVEGSHALVCGFCREFPSDSGDPAPEDGDVESPHSHDGGGGSGRRRGPSVAWFVCKQLLFLATGFTFGGVCVVGVHRVARTTAATAMATAMALPPNPAAVVAAVEAQVAVPVLGRVSARVRH
jgi:hypothetical protein